MINASTARSPGKLRVASCQIPVSDDIDRNAGYVTKLIAEAAADGAEVAHFPAAALSGLGGHDFLTWDDYPWQVLRAATDRVCQAAAEHRVWVIVGSAHRLCEPHKPLNSLYLIDPQGQLVDRYDKRFCTRGDLVCYSPGDHFVTFTINGITCGLAICFDVRFPEFFRAYQRLGVQCLFHSFHNIGTEAGLLTTIIRPTLQANAANNYLWISAVNASNYYQLWPSTLIQPDGTLISSMRQHRTGYCMHVVDGEQSFYDASGDYRQRVFSGQLSSADAPADPRRDQRTEF